MSSIFHGIVRLLDGVCKALGTSLGLPRRHNQDLGSLARRAAGHPETMAAPWPLKDKENKSENFDTELNLG